MLRPSPGNGAGRCPVNGEQEYPSSAARVVAECRAMAKKTDVPGYLTISPLTLVCPKCHAKPGKDCVALPGGVVGLVHVSRIKAAAKLDHANSARAK